MLLPMVLLGVGAVFAGAIFATPFVGEGGAAFWHGSLAFNSAFMESVEHVPAAVKLSATVAMLIGLVVAWYAYMVDRTVPARSTATFRGLYAFLLNKWYFDELYDILFVRPAFAIGRFFWKRGDQQTIDRFGPNGAAWVAQGASLINRRLQSGYVYTYALVMLLGLAAATTWAIGR
jgi:NADH-quinone oxidoreductase subunit L